MRRWSDYSPHRDGPVNVEKPAEDDPAHISDLIKAKGLEVGGGDVGDAALTPIMINEGSDSF